MHQFLIFIFGIKPYLFRTVPPSIIRSFSLYTQQWYMSCRFADNLQAGSGWNILILLASCQQTYMTLYHCCVYSEKLLMMDRGTVRNKQGFIPKINLRNWCIWLVYYKKFITMHGHMNVKLVQLNCSVPGASNHSDYPQQKS